MGGRVVEGENACEWYSVLGSETRFPVEMCSSLLRQQDSTSTFWKLYMKRRSFLLCSFLLTCTFCCGLYISFPIHTRSYTMLPPSTYSSSSYRSSTSYKRRACSTGQDSVRPRTPPPAYKACDFPDDESGGENKVSAYSMLSGAPANPVAGESW